jgi:tetratricopeptide (TPR) repeat protein
MAITLLSGCQLPGNISSPFANSDKAKPSWTSKIARNLKPGAKPQTLDPIAQKMALARSLESQGKTAEAIYTYSSILAKEERADAHHRIAVLHDKAGNFPASDEHYQVALKLEPKNAELLCDRGYSFLLQDRLAEAQEQLEKAIKRDSDLTRAHNNLGLLLAQQGHIDRALVQFAAAGCSHAEARTNLAYALTMAGNVADAQYHLQLARQADITLQEAGQLTTALGQGTPTEPQQEAVPQKQVEKPRRVASHSSAELPVSDSGQVSRQAFLPPAVMADHRAVALPPTNEQSDSESPGQLIDYQTMPSERSQPTSTSEAPVTNQRLGEILRMSANVEPNLQQQLAERKQAQLRRALERLNKNGQLGELVQPLSVRALDSQ